MTAASLVVLMLVAAQSIPGVLPPGQSAARTHDLAPQEVTAAAAEPALQPGPIVQEAFDLLMDRHVIPPSSSVLLNAGWDRAVALLRDQGVAEPPTERPALTGEREHDWQAFAAGYPSLLSAVDGRLETVQLDRAVIRGMADSLQTSATAYFESGAFQPPQAERRYAGVGSVLFEGFVVGEVYEGRPAAAAGVQPGDRLLAVDGASVEGLSSAEVSERVRGPAGTAVELTFERPGTAEPVILDIVRAEISVDWVAWRLLDDGNGYLRLRSFPAPEALGAFQSAIEQLRAANVKGLIVDLRGNTGGSTETLQQIASRFIPEGTLYQTTYRDGRRITLVTDGVYWGHSVPIIVLVDQQIAGSSELLAAALRESEVGTLIGTTTAGRVGFFSVAPLSDGSRLHITAGIAETGDGRMLDRVGLEPDQAVDLDRAELGAGRDSQLQAALNLLHQLVR